LKKGEFFDRKKRF